MVSSRTGEDLAQQGITHDPGGPAKLKRRVARLSEKNDFLKEELPQFTKGYKWTAP